MGAYQNLFASIAIAAALTNPAEAQAPDAQSEARILSCFEEVDEAVTIEGATHRFNANTSAFLYGVGGEERKSDVAKIEMRMKQPSRLGLSSIYDHEVTFRSEYYDSSQDIEVWARVRMEFQLRSGERTKYSFFATAQGDDMEQRTAYKEQLTHAVEAMALMFTACMNLPLYENRNGNPIRPPEYFPVPPSLQQR